MFDKEELDILEVFENDTIIKFIDVKEEIGIPYQLFSLQLCKW